MEEEQAAGQEENDTNNENNTEENCKGEFKPKYFFCHNNTFIVDVCTYISVL